MAVDATGTPTSKGIPKYNPDVDAPSGLGFNGAMDAIDALFDKAQYSTDTKVTDTVPVWNGTAWVYKKVGMNRLATASASPPGSPVDGDIWIYDAGSGVRWTFVYNSSEPTYKWQFIGGSALMATVDTFETLASGTYAALTTAGPSITIPRAGDYDVTVWSATNGGGGSGAVTNFHSYMIGATAAQDADAALALFVAVGAGWHSPSMTRRKTLSAGTALVSQYRGATTQTAGWSYRGLSARPVRVI